MIDLHELLGHHGPDAGCEEAFALMDRYAEAQTSGRDAADEFPGVAAHLANCTACREDMEGLRAALAQAL